MEQLTKDQAVKIYESGIWKEMSAKVLRIDSQAGKICLWALVNPLEFKTLRRFDVFGTGHPIPEDGQERVFVNTFLMHEGMYVFHAFEVISQ